MTLGMLLFILTMGVLSAIGLYIQVHFVLWFCCGKFFWWRDETLRWAFGLDEETNP